MRVQNLHVDLLKDLIIIIRCEILKLLQLGDGLLIGQLELFNLRDVDFCLRKGECDLRVLSLMLLEKSVHVETWQLIEIFDRFFDAIVDDWVEIPVLSASEGLHLRRIHPLVSTTHARVGIVEWTCCGD